MNGIERIAAERARQLMAEEDGGEDWDAIHDSTHDRAELCRAARSYTGTAANQILNSPEVTIIPVDWPWSEEWWKPSADPIRNLEKAGALIAAEIDRVQAA